MLTIHKYLTIFLLTIFMAFATPVDNNNTTNKSSMVTKALKKEFKTNPSKLLKNVPQKRFLKNFYRKNHYQSLWIENDKLNQKKYSTLFQHIKNDLTLNKKGLIFQQYQNLNKFISDTNLTETKLLRLEMKLSSLYYNFLKHSLYGEIEWKKLSYKLSSLKKSRINASWVRYKPSYRLETLMNQEDISSTIDKIMPKKFGYKGLLLALEKLEKLKEAGGWKKLLISKKLSLGSTGDIIIQLRSRLKTSGDYLICEDNSSKSIINQENNESKEFSLNTEVIHLEKDAIFGECLNKAVKHFQKRHGLMVDGIVGGGTKKALNITVDEKIRKVLLNIDRTKWLPREENKRYLVVNVPEFMLHYVENNETKQKLRVIVGDKRHPTPIFSQTISFIVLNPYWKVPEGIVKREVIPAMVKNPNYLRKQGLEAHRTWDENSRIIDTSWLYWEDYLYGGEKFPYRLMQPPGPKNALGKIKFKFPNRFSVYLHDTPTKHLFKKTVRAFSHGCVRLSQPRKLLETIATFNTNINIKKAKKILKGKRKTQLNMREKLPIYLVYLTAGMNEDGVIEFRNDIYRYDKFTKRRTN